MYLFIGVMRRCTRVVALVLMTLMNLERYIHTCLCINMCLLSVCGSGEKRRWRSFCVGISLYTKTCSRVFVDDNYTVLSLSYLVSYLVIGCFCCTNRLEVEEDLFGNTVGESLIELTLQPWAHASFYFGVVRSSFVQLLTRVSCWQECVHHSGCSAS